MREFWDWVAVITDAEIGIRYAIRARFVGAGADAA
jgi:hypothetical protein